MVLRYSFELFMLLHLKQLAFIAHLHIIMEDAPVRSNFPYLFPPSWHAHKTLSCTIQNRNGFFRLS